MGPITVAVTDPSLGPVWMWANPKSDTWYREVHGFKTHPYSLRVVKNATSIAMHQRRENVCHATLPAGITETSEYPYFELAVIATGPHVIKV